MKSRVPRHLAGCEAYMTDSRNRLEFIDTMRRCLSREGLELKNSNDAYQDWNAVYVGKVDGVDAAEYGLKVEAHLSTICARRNWHCFSRHFPFKGKEHGMFSVTFALPFKGIARWNPGGD